MFYDHDIWQLVEPTFSAARQTLDHVLLEPPAPHGKPPVLEEKKRNALRLGFFALVHQLQHIAPQAIDLHDAVLGTQRLARRKLGPASREQAVWVRCALLLLRVCGLVDLWYSWSPLVLLWNLAGELYLGAEAIKAASKPFPLLSNIHFVSYFLKPRGHVRNCKHESLLKCTLWKHPNAVGGIVCRQLGELDSNGFRCVLRLMAATLTYVACLEHPLTCSVDINAKGKLQHSRVRFNKHL